MLRIIAKDLVKNYTLPVGPKGLIRSFFSANKKVVPALDKVSLQVGAGEALGIIGENGAGKTTLLKVLAGITSATSGDYQVNGKVATLLDLASGFRQDFTARENILLAGAMQGYSENDVKKKVDAILDFSGLHEFADQPIRTFSDGMQVRLGFSTSALLSSEILLVDEVLAVGDQRFQRKCLEWVKRFLVQGGSIVLVSHSLHLVTNMCNKAVWLEQGRIRAQGPSQQVVDGYIDKMRELEHEEAQHEKGLASGSDEGAGTSRASEEERKNAFGKGSKEAIIISVELLDSNEEKKKVFKSGEAMKVRVKFNALKKIDSPSLGVAIFRNDDVYVYGANTRFDAEDTTMRVFEGEHSFSIVFDSLPLLGGSYQVSVAMYDKDHVFPYDFHDRLYNFSVQTDKQDHGLVILDHHWEID
ncbi:MAG: ABC transporter ATP-binding protein [Deltaproteobacteria bacterium]|nr:ABC transporter ATP-binding protein [Deltaproteobacteria bacterium]